MILQFEVRINFLLNSYFPSTSVEWNKLDSVIPNSPSFSIFKKDILNFIRPLSNDVFNVIHPKGIIVVTRLLVGLSNLREHKFKHSFLKTRNPICICVFDIETLNHFLLHCSRFTD